MNTKSKRHDSLTEEGGGSGGGHRVGRGQGARDDDRGKDQSGEDGGRSHGGEALNDTVGVDDGDGAKSSESLGTDGKQPGNTVGPGGCNGGIAMTIQGIPGG